MGLAEWIVDHCTVTLALDTLCTELTVEVHSIYISQSTEISVAVLSPGYRTHCGGAQCLWKAVYRHHFGVAQYIYQSSLENSARRIYVSLANRPHCGGAQYTSQFV